MSPENDQCRWVGIRPTNPKEDIPITLDGEVAHVIVDSGGGGLAPGAPIIAYWYVGLVGSGIWNTLLNIAVGSGHIQKIHLGIVGNFQDVECKVTVDGGAAVTYTTTIQTRLLWNDITSGAINFKEVPIYLIAYTTSVKVEIRQVSGAARNLYGLCSYLPG